VGKRGGESAAPEKWQRKKAPRQKTQKIKGTRNVAKRTEGGARGDEGQRLRDKSLKNEQKKSRVEI